MTTETEWGVQFDRPGEALTVMQCTSEAQAREMAEAYQAIEVMAYVVNREVTYGRWQEQP